MIDPVRKVIFIHPEKSGGTSIEKAFNAQWFLNKYQIKINTPYVLKNEQIAPWNYMAEKYPTEWKEYKKIAIVRNPIDRFLSRHRFFLKAEKALYEVAKDNLDENGIWQDLLYATIKHKSRGSFSAQNQQWFKLGDLDKYDYILRCENLQEDWTNMIKSLNLKDLPEEVPHANVSGPKLDSLYYFGNFELKKIIAFLFKKDLETFDYTIGKISDVEASMIKKTCRTERVSEENIKFLSRVYQFDY